MGLLGSSGACAPGLALRRSDRMAARDDRPQRDGGALRGSRLHAGAPAPRLAHVPGALRDAVHARAQATDDGHLARVPRDRGRPGDRSRPRRAGAARAPADAVHYGTAARRGRRPAPRARPACPASTRTPRWRSIDDARGRWPRTRPTAQLARSAEGSPTHAQDRSSTSDGPVRFTAPSVIFEHADGRRLEVGGFQPFEAYDTALANLDVSLDRRPPPADPLEALGAFPDGLTTAELAAVLRPSDLVDADLAATEAQLVALSGDEGLICEPVGGDALWRLAGS